MLYTFCISKTNILPIKRNDVRDILINMAFYGARSDYEPHFSVLKLSLRSRAIKRLRRGVELFLPSRVSRYVARGTRTSMQFCTVEPPVSDHPKHQDVSSGRLREAVAYESRTRGGLVQVLV